MAVTITLESDEAIVLFELLASKSIGHSVAAPERSALWRLEAALEKQLTEPLSPDYPQLLEKARKSLVVRYGQ